jgi:hypothetical protein
MSPAGTNRTKEKDFTLKYKRYAKPYMSPTGTNRTNKGLHIKVQEVCNAVYGAHRDKLCVFCPFKNSMVNVPKLPCIRGIL